MALVFPLIRDIRQAQGGVVVPDVQHDVIGECSHALGDGEATTVTLWKRLLLLLLLLLLLSVP